MKVSVVQSNYIPWKGYFDLIAQSDLFILYDEVQYTKNDWRNRNQIKTAQGVQWLTIPIKMDGRFGQSIAETETAKQPWAEKHWKTLLQNYRKAPHFARYAEELEAAYAWAAEEPRLSLINERFIRMICGWLGLETQIHWSTDYPTEDQGRNERLLGLLRASGASLYFSGPAARSYMDVPTYEAAGVKVHFMDYSLYPPYPQLHGEFVHGVTVLDVLFHVGPDAQRYVRSRQL